METHAYSELYLSHAMVNLAVMADCGINGYGISPSLFFYRFVTSGIAEQFGRGNPKYLVGYSGLELADQVVSNSGGGYLKEENVETFGKTPEYWAGWVLAYYQWKSGRSFSEMQRKGLDFSTVIPLYHPLHEADVEKFCDIAECIVKENSQGRNPVRDARERRGMTQKSLAEISGVSLRMIRAYEQGTQDLSRAEYRTVERLARVLDIPSEQLIH